MPQANEMEAEAAAAAGDEAAVDEENQDEDAEVTDLAEAEDTGDLDNHPEESLDAEALLAESSETAFDDASKADIKALDADTSVQQDHAEQSALQASTVVTSTPKVPLGTQLKPANVSKINSSKGDNADSGLYETGDDSFVVQVDDTVLNDIDSDLLDPSQANEGKTSDSPAAQGSSDQAQESEKSPENTESKEAENTADKPEESKGAVASQVKEDKEGKATVKSGAAKTVKKDEKVSQSSRNLWVSGLSSSTRATDLKALFSKHGKVIGAKVVTNARAPGSRCYGFVTMGSADEATKCIQHLHRTELHGRMISVERAKTEPQGSKAGAKVLPPSGIKSPLKRPAKKDGDKESKEGSTEKSKDDGKGSEKEKDRSHLSEKTKRELDVLSFEKIKAERERMRLRNKELYLRHEERRRQMHLERESYKTHMMQKSLEGESMKLEREKRKLRRMREDLERERVETERMKLQTERLRIQREQESYRREQERVLQDRRPMKRPLARDDEWSTSKRPADRFNTDRSVGTARYGTKSERFETRAEERPARFEARREQRPGRHERFEERAGPARGERDYRGAREEHRPGFREERPRGRDAGRETARQPQRHEARGESRGTWGSGDMEWSSQSQDGKWVEPSW